MKYIAHRGNISGKNPERENTVDYIMEAIEKFYMVEVDVRSLSGKLFLGHDENQQPLPNNLLKRKEIIYHAKDYGVIEILSSVPSNPHWFFHENDLYTLTSKGWIWQFPETILPNVDFCVKNQPEYCGGLAKLMRWCMSILNDEQIKPFAVCSDYCQIVKTYIENGGYINNDKQN